MDMIAIVMAGGTGTRFWPLSRTERPKQVLSLGDQPVLLKQTLDRLEAALPTERIYVITAREHESVIRDHAGSVPPGNVIAEPEGRDTAACAALGSMIARDQLGNQGVMGLFPADHLIQPRDLFAHFVELAYRVTGERGGIVTFGIPPDHPSTGYGYIRYDDASGEEVNDQVVYAVESFTEKPDRNRARDFLSQGNYLWNSGMFFWKAGHFLSEVKRCLPGLHEGLDRIQSEWRETGDLRKALEKHYARLPAISVDYGILEKTDRVFTLPVSFEWSDLGTWDSLEKLFDTDENSNVRVGNVVSLDSVNSILFGSDSMLIGTIGVEGLVVVATEDAVLVCPKDRAEDVKALVNELKQDGYQDHV